MFFPGAGAPMPEARGGDMAWVQRRERHDGGGFTAPLRAKGRQMERGASRGGESEAKALAGWPPS